ncbi:MAG TPA: SusC/RagA family TonB-linked outer membrane protein [Longimicrobiales bacterium]|nr:SusC/RagA family TonB-linked outer membrane protein [Longimicrobiales bacterium]
MISLRSALTCLAAGLLTALPAAAQQTGSVTGTVTSAGTGEPLAGVQVSIEGTGLGTLTQANGRYLILQVPAGQQTVRADLIGYGTVTQTVTVTAGQGTTVNLRMESEAIAMSEIVVTGVAGATQRTKLPFEVAQVNFEDLPVPTPNPASSLQGKVSGVTVVQGSGRPGSAPSILLRGPTSLNASGRDQEPLYIVDGVILGSSLVDMSALDIESVEVVKGAAAASMYGSRAANGVVQIRTKRGRNMMDNDVRYTVRSEFGRSALASIPDQLLTRSHQYEVTNGQFVNSSNGQPCDWLACTSPRLAGQWAAPGQARTAWNTVQAVPWPGTTYNQVDRFFEEGNFMQHYLSAEGRTGATNFHVSVSNLQDEGVMPGMEGFDRTNLRVNVDQAVMEQLQVQASAFYSTSDQGQFPESQGNPLFDLTRMPAGVDLMSEDPDAPGEIVLLVDPTNNESPNPLYQMFNRKYSEGHSRFLGSLNARFSPISWFDIDANASYDRRDLDQRDYYPKGYRTINSSASLNEGNLWEFRRRDDAINASLTGTFRLNLTDGITNRTQLRYLYEAQDRSQVESGGSQFAVRDVPTLDNLDQSTLSSGSYENTIRADGYFVITNFDIFDKYVIDGLVRNDGSSLFGEDERRQWYYRVAGAWRLSQEPWFSIPGIDEFKLRYSLGTAGGRPNFEAQYETFSVSGGFVRPVTLGNTLLKPEHTTEHEAGIDASFFDNRIGLGLTYANASTEDLILPVPLAAYTGYQTQWQNAGTIQSKTWEVTLDARLLNRDNVNWSAKLLFDRTRSDITELNVPVFQYGVGGQGLGSVFYARPGEEIGTFYGTHYATSCADLPTGMSCDGFAVNDDGLLVWVGASGLDDPQWGTDSDVTIRNARVKWGTPFAGECTDRSTGQRTLFCPVGNSMPDWNAALSTNFSFKGIGLYALLGHSHGFDVYNQPLQWGTFKRYSGIMDQTGVPEAQQKPIGYYDAMYGVSGLQPSNLFVEDATFTKLREVSVSYRFSSDMLSGVPGLSRFNSIGISLTGRNLYTWTDYRGFDPEVGKGGGETGSAALARVEGFQYPNFRTFTAAIDVVF